MSYSNLAVILFAIIAVTSAFPTSDNNTENVLARFYPDFVQLYRPATSKSYVNSEQTIERYQFNFTEREYLTISVESLTMVNTDVLDRTITYHPLPNFEVTGTRYLYRGPSDKNETKEIELVNPKELLFRDVKKPDQYFYLATSRYLEYPNQTPVMPYYEVTFICNSTSSNDRTRQPPLLSYIDRSFKYTPRYSIDLPSSSNSEPAEIIAYADIRNWGEKTITLKGVEVVVGDIRLNPKAVRDLRLSIVWEPTTGRRFSFFHTPSSKTRFVSQQDTATYVYPLSLPSSVTLPPSSLKSLQFLTPNVKVERFATYSLAFFPYSTSGKLYKAYNLTNYESFLPAGRLFLRDQGRFVGQINLPDLSTNQTYTMVFGYDDDVNYRREVKTLDGDEDSDSKTYEVKYIFENISELRDIRVSFRESFSLFKYFQVENLLTSDNKDKVICEDTILHGLIDLPRKSEEKTVSYKLITYKHKPIMNSDEH